MSYLKLKKDQLSKNPTKPSFQTRFWKADTKEVYHHVGQTVVPLFIRAQERHPVSKRIMVMSSRAHMTAMKIMMLFRHEFTRLAIESL